MSTHDLLEHACAVAKRQAFGVRLEARPDDKATVEALVRARIHLPPHDPATMTYPIDWTSDPFGQRNWRAQLQMLRWIDPIRRLAADGDLGAMDLWESVVRDWVSAHPPRPDSTTYAWADMVDGVRAHVLLMGLPYVTDPGWLLRVLEEHGRWLADAEHLGHDNHALHQHAALFMLGTALRKDSWVRSALERINGHVASAFDGDGVNAEAAPGYWLLNFRWLKDLAHRLELEGARSSLLSSTLERVPLTIAHAIRPDGLIEEIGDTAPRARPRTGESPELTYLATDGGAGVPPAETAALYPAGYAFGRSGWGETERRLVEESFYSLRFGPGNGVHGHIDGGSLTYFADGAQVLVDAGKYAYSRDAASHYVTGRLGHNVVHVRGRNYDKTASVELVSHLLADDHDYFHLRDRGYDGVVIDRRVVYSRQTEAIVVVDSVKADASISAETRWHLHEKARTVLGRARAEIRLGSSRATILWGGSTPSVETIRGREDPMDGWRSPGWGTLVPTTVVKAIQTGTHFRFVTALVPGATSADRLEAGEVRDGVTGFLVEVNGVREQVWVGPSGAVLERVAGSAGGAIRTARRIDVDADTIERFEAENATSRSALGVGGVPIDDLDRLTDRLATGWDYGAGAILEDHAFAWPDSVQPKWPRDARTRRASQVGRPFAGDRLSTPPVQHHAGHPSSYDLGERESRHLLELGATALPFHVRRGTSSSMIVSFHGALNRVKTKLPRFERMRSLEALDAHVVAFSDPTLDLDPSLTLGWYLGTRSLDLHDEIARVVEKLAAQLECDRIVLIGTSGGGFASLQVGARIPDSCVVVANPQTSVLDYHPRFSHRAMAGLFGSLDGVASDNPRLSVVARYRSIGRAPNITYQINSGDVHHVEVHGRPYWGLMDERHPGQLEVEWLELGNGHLAPSVEVFNAAIVKHLLVRKDAS